MASIVVDPRWFQAGTLAGLLAVNVAWFDLGASAAQGMVTVVAALVFQALGCGVVRVRFDAWSPLITGLSLSLLLRTPDPAIWIAAAGLAVGSKFLLRVRGKHVFNPATFAIVALLGVGANVWVSPGQWGAATWFAVTLAAFGGLVLTRSRRLDIACAFAVAYAGLLAARALWLGDPVAIPLHQLQSGSLLLFAGFMLTDPRSTPDNRAGRVLFAVAVAALAYHLQYDLQLRTGLFWALASLSLATPLIDVVLPAERFRWRPMQTLEA